MKDSGRSWHCNQLQVQIWPFVFKYGFHKQTKEAYLYNPELKTKNSAIINQLINQKLFTVCNINTYGLVNRNQSEYESLKIWVLTDEGSKEPSGHSVLWTMENMAIHGFSFMNNMTVVQDNVRFRLKVNRTWSKMVKSAAEQ